MWKTYRLCDGARKRSNTLAATISKREASCHLHGMLPEERIAAARLAYDHARMCVPRFLFPTAVDSGSVF